ncbi:pyridoxamine 5'-phosphate oxidase family protein [Dietzia sp. SLG510A3-3B2-2]|nr:pyridoxamine 5'-phosphate oxidase family protein [Dietzia sp. SLG510A3-40A3]MBB1008354.1 pyridoxamine 5'-phosphate oxidase family protein [Dietzia sp. SLG510A3-3B2-2]
MAANHYPGIAYGPAVRARQNAVGVTLPVATGDFALEGTDVALIRSADHFSLSTVTESGWPYTQHRGGPAGFVSTGNVDHDGRVCLLFVDYPTRRRLKVFGHARTVEPDSDPDLIDRLRAMGEKRYSGRVERAIVVDVVAADANCSKHITPRWNRRYIDELTAVYKRRIAELQAGSA